MRQRARPRAMRRSNVFFSGRNLTGGFTGVQLVVESILTMP